MNEHEDLISRLRAFGRRPVDADLAARHGAAMAAGADAQGPRRAHRLRVVSAFVVGLLVGTSGLATAGALPNGAQEIAHQTLGSVGVKVPHGDRYQGPECGGVVKNHGQYVRSQPKGSRATAAKSRCGKPLQAGAGDDTDGQPPAEATECQGPPPWAGKGKPDKAAKDARKQACGDEKEVGDEKEAGDEKQSGDEKQAPAPAAGAVDGTVPVPEMTSTSATTSTTATTTDTSTSTNEPEEDTPSTTALPVPGLGS